MIAYLIKSALCLLVLWGFYTLVLEGQAANRLKRGYLLLSLLCALILPLLTFTYTTAALREPEIIQQPIILQQVDAMQLSIVEPSIDWIFWIIGAVYLLGVVIFGFRFARNLYRLRHCIVTNEKRKESAHTKVLLAQKTTPHSFLRYIFLNKTEYKNQQIAPEILAHEQAHVSGRHSWDILFIELLQVVFWFNPLLVLVKKSMAINHEFLADEAALGDRQNPDTYINLLFQYSGGSHHAALSSPINYSLTKKRILMLSQSFSAKKLATRLTLLIPVLALCIYFFNQDIVAKPVLQEIEQSSNDQKTTVYYQEGQLPINMIIKQKDAQRYLQNSKTTTLERKIPSSQELKDWEDGKKYGVWVDGSRVKNSVLKEKSSSDFDYYGISKLEKNAFNYGAHFYQVNLMSPNYFEKKREMSGLLSIAEIQKYLILDILVKGNEVNVNGKPSSLEKFVEDIDELTASWNRDDMMSYSIRLSASNGVDKFLNRLFDEFRKTKIYKVNPSKELIPPPPPPAPDAPETQNVRLIRTQYLEAVEKLEKMTPEGYPAAFLNLSPQEQQSFQTQYLKTSDLYKKLDQKDKDQMPLGLAPAPDPSMYIEKDGKIIKKPGSNKISPVAIPASPAPPTPPNPTAMIKEITAAGSDIYYNGKKITEVEAKKLVSKNDTLNFMYTGTGKGKKPLMFIF